jgi:hypothetical protein
LGPGSPYSESRLLGLGDVELVGKEKIQPKAGRLDLLLHSEVLNRRYEVELMLGATDPSHIMRCIEYWDIERRRYPAYDHVAVLVAEDITSRFLNLMALLAGSIPLIAIQMAALRVDNKILLHLTLVLDQTELRTDDEFELGESGGPTSKGYRSWWEGRVPPTVLQLCDELRGVVEQVSGVAHHAEYLKRFINLVRDDDGDCLVWLIPRKTVVNVGAYVEDREAWIVKFEEAGLFARLRRGNKAVLVSATPEAYEANKGILKEFLQDAFSEGELVAD